MDCVQCTMDPHSDALNKPWQINWVFQYPWYGSICASGRYTLQLVNHQNVITFSIINNRWIKVTINHCCKTISIVFSHRNSKMLSNNTVVRIPAWEYCCEYSCTYSCIGMLLWIQLYVYLNGNYSPHVVTKHGYKAPQIRTRKNK